MTAIPVDAVLSNAVSDTDLIAASRRGDRQAFGQIVRRYQGMVSGLIYAACGDLHRSEDLAQETFLSAWKSLSGLRDPAKLAGWLCQIARHRAQDQLRHQSVERASILGFSKTHKSISNTADEALARKEEEAVLWRALEEIPQPYRETLVLYYRQDRSTADVAAAMETSEEAIRQRLARGRELLRSHVAEMLERNLAQTKPSPSFAAAVVAALPALVTQSAAQATAGAGAGAAAAKSGGVLAATLPYLGVLGGLASGIAGSKGALEDDRTADERKLTVAFLIKVWLGALLVAAGTIIIVRLRNTQHWSSDLFVPVMAGFWTLYWITHSTVIVRYQYRSRLIRAADRPVPHPPISGCIILAAGVVIATLGWMIPIASARSDIVGVVAIVSAIGLGTAINALVIRRQIRYFIPVLTLTLALANAGILNWRLERWAEAVVPLWSVNVSAVAVVAWIAVVTVLSHTPREIVRQHPPTSTQ